MDNAEKNAVAQDSFARPVWFFEINGESVPLYEEAASVAYYNKGHRLLGHSDGKTFYKIMDEVRDTLLVATKQYQAAQDRFIRLGEAVDKFLYEDLLEEDDPKVVAAQEKQDEAEKKMIDFKRKLELVSKGQRTKALDAELEIAKQNIVPPPSRDVLNPKNDARIKEMEGAIKQM